MNSRYLKGSFELTEEIIFKLIVYIDCINKSQFNTIISQLLTETLDIITHLQKSLIIKHQILLRKFSEFGAKTQNFGERTHYRLKNNTSFKHIQKALINYEYYIYEKQVDQIDVFRQYLIKNQSFKENQTLAQLSNLQLKHLQLCMLQLRNLINKQTQNVFNDQTIDLAVNIQTFQKMVQTHFLRLSENLEFQLNAKVLRKAMICNGVRTSTKKNVILPRETGVKLNFPIADHVEGYVQSLFHANKGIQRSIKNYQQLAQVYFQGSAFKKNMDNNFKNNNFQQVQIQEVMSSEITPKKNNYQIKNDKQMTHYLTDEKKKNFQQVQIQDKKNNYQIQEAKLEESQMSKKVKQKEDKEEKSEPSLSIQASLRKNHLIKYFIFNKHLDLQKTTFLQNTQQAPQRPSQKIDTSLQLGSQQIRESTVQVREFKLPMITTKNEQCHSHVNNLVNKKETSQTFGYLKSNYISSNVKKKNQDYLRQNTNLF